MKETSSDFFLYVFIEVVHTLTSVYELAFGPRLRPKVATTLTNRLLYWKRRLARPVFFFFFSCFSTLGVCPLTLPARARDPWTLPKRVKKIQLDFRSLFFGIRYGYVQQTKANAIKNLKWVCKYVWRGLHSQFAKNMFSVIWLSSHSIAWSACDWYVQQPYSTSFVRTMKIGSKLLVVGCFSNRVLL